MARKEIPVSTRILISIIVVIGASISIINLLTIYGILKTPDMLTYVLMIGVYTLPFIIIGATLNKIFMEQKSALENVAKGTQEVGKRLELKINFKPWENIMADTSSHPAFYVKIAIASALSVSVGLLSYSVFSQRVFVGPLSTMIPAFAPLFAVCLLIHLFSKHIFGPHGWRELLEHSWISLLVITFSLSMMMSLRTHITESYPRQFWERFLNLPFSLPTLLFFAIMLIIGGILIRLGDIIQLESSPLKASGTTFILLSIGFLFPRFDLLDWGVLLTIVSQLFAGSMVVYGLAIAGLLYKDAGMRFLVTNERVVKLDTNRLERSSYYPLVDLKEVKIAQDFLSSTFGYGNVVMIFKLKDGGKKTKAYCILYGVKNPELITNTIKVIAKLKKTQVKPKRPIVKKRGKRPVKRKKTPLKKKRVRKKRDDFYYRALIPVFALLMISLIASGINGDTIDNPERLILERYDINYISASRTEINATFEIYGFSFDDEYLEADDIRDLVLLSPEKVEGEFRNMTYEHTERTINRLFWTDRQGIHIYHNFTLQHDSLYGEPGEEEPIVYKVDVGVVVEPKYFDLPKHTNIDTIFMCILEVGGRLVLEFELECEPGHHVTYRFNSMPDTVFENENNVLLYEIDNRPGKEIISEDISIEIFHNQPVHVDETDISSYLLIDIYELDRGDKGEYLDINVIFSADLTSIRIPDELREHIPGELELEYLDAKTIRILYNNGLGSPIRDYIRTYEDMLNEQVYSWGNVVQTGEIALTVMDPSLDDKPIQLQYNASVRTILSRGNDVAGFIPREFSFSDTFNIPLKGPDETTLDVTILIPEGLDLMRARLSGRNIPIRQNSDGRYYTVATIEEGKTENLSLVIGTTVYLMDFLPFMIFIIVLLAIWVGLNVYKVKPRND